MSEDTEAQPITVKISASGRVTIPKAIRERLSFRSGTEVTIEVRGEAIIVKRIAPAGGPNA